ncbi:hypothetical protein ACH4U6_00385 [Streptomyces netropsis]|uniref:hypothetical protein n=1 Tax=Streptomyces netropsis TaxID=55404 RepID=UPI0037B8C1FB
MAATFGTHDGIETTLELLRTELPQLEKHQQTLETDLAVVTERLESVRLALRSLEALAPAPLARAATAVAATPSGLPDSVGEQGSEASKAPAPVAPPRQTTEAKPQATRGKKAAGETKPAAGKATGSRKRTASTAEGKVPRPRVAKKAVAAKKQPAKKAVAVKKEAKATAPKEVQADAGKAAQATSAEQPKKRASGLTKDVVAHLAKAGAPVKAREVNLALGRDDTNGSINAVRTSLERLVKAGQAHRPGRGLYQATSG